jgi:hypothetical protein
VSAELLAQKRAALGSPDGEQAAGTSGAEHSEAVSVGIAAPQGSASEKTAESLRSGLSDSAAAADSTSAAAGAAHLHQASADGTPLSDSTALRKQPADDQGKDANASSSTLAFHQLSLTFKHGAPFMLLKASCRKLHSH